MEGRVHQVDDSHRVMTPQLDMPERLLLGPGPSNMHPRVRQALGMNEVGHLDPRFIGLMNESQELLRYVWQTDNRFTIPVSGTGSAAMEAALANCVEPGDIVLVGVNGYFGERLCDMASRYGANVRRLEKPWGETFDPEEIAIGLETHRPVLLGLIHAETSTGALQPMTGIGKLCREFDCLLLLDTVTSLGGVPVFLDRWHVDMSYSATQKCLSCPPGLAPLTLGDRALAKLNNRKIKVANWYLDMSLVGKYWGQETYLPPYCSHQHELRPSRGLAPHSGRGSLGSVGKAYGKCRDALGRPRRLGNRLSRRKRVPPAEPHDCIGPRRCRQ